MKTRISVVHPKAVVPTYGSDGAACFDLYAAQFLEPKMEPLKLDQTGAATFVDEVTVDTGLIFEVPPGYGLFIFPRSGLAFSHGINLKNTVGIVDSDYRGPVQIILRRNVRYDYVANAVVTASGFPQQSQSQKMYDSVVDDFSSHTLSVGDRVAQACILPIERVEFEVVDRDVLTRTVRGDGGFGSTGK